MPEENKEINISPEQKKVADILKTLKVSSFAELYQKFKTEDNNIFSKGPWDDQDDTLILNQIKTALESIDLGQLDTTEEEKEWYTDTLWLWYQHAISTAIWFRKDRLLAQKYADKAVELQGDEPYNKLSKLLQYLVYDDVVGAKKYVVTITKEPEKTSAQEIIEEYERGEFFV